MIQIYIRPARFIVGANNIHNYHLGFREILNISDNSLIETVITGSAWRSSKLLQLCEDYLYWP